MRLYRAQSSPLRFVWLLLPLLCLGLAVWLWGHVSELAADLTFDRDVFLLGVTASLALVLAGLLGYIAWSALTIHYTLDDDYLRLKCDGVTHVIPLDNVSSVHAPGEMVENRPLKVQRHWVTLPLPGYYVGGGRSPQLGRVVHLATTPSQDQVFVVTPSVTFGISPQERSAFVSDLTKRRKLDPSPEESVRTELSGIGAWGARLWADRPARLLFLAGIGLNALLFFYISLVYADLPSRLPLHWNSQGVVDIIGDPIELLRLPVFALGVWLLNVALAWAVRPRERAATIFLLAGGVAAQVVFAAGALSIVARAL